MEQLYTLIVHPLLEALCHCLDECMRFCDKAFVDVKRRRDVDSNETEFKNCVVRREDSQSIILGMMRYGTNAIIANTGTKQGFSASLMKGDEVYSVQGIPVKGMSTERVATLLSPMKKAEDHLMSVDVAKQCIKFLNKAATNLVAFRDVANGEDNNKITKPSPDVRLRHLSAANTMREDFRDAYGHLLKVEALVKGVLVAGDKENCKTNFNCGANYWSLGIVQATCQAAQKFFFDNDLWSIDKCSEFCADNDFIINIENGLKTRLLTLKEEQGAPTPCKAAQSVALPSELMTKVPPTQTGLDIKWLEHLEAARDAIASVLRAWQQMVAKQKQQTRKLSTLLDDDFLAKILHRCLAPIWHIIVDYLHAHDHLFMTVLRGAFGGGPDETIFVRVDAPKSCSKGLGLALRSTKTRSGDFGPPKAVCIEPGSCLSLNLNHYDKIVAINGADASKDSTRCAFARFSRFQRPVTTNSFFINPKNASNSMPAIFMELLKDVDECREADTYKEQFDKAQKYCTHAGLFAALKLLKDILMTIESQAPSSAKLKYQYFRSVINVFAWMFNLEMNSDEVRKRIEMALRDAQKYTENILDDKFEPRDNDLDRYMPLPESEKTAPAFGSGSGRQSAVPSAPPLSDDSSGSTASPAPPTYDAATRHAAHYDIALDNLGAAAEGEGGGATKDGPDESSDEGTPPPPPLTPPTSYIGASFAPLNSPGIDL